MKKLILLLILFAYQSNAQDIIYLSNGDSIDATVMEVDDHQIRYKRFNFQDGPYYTANRSEVLSITYKNGQEDIFIKDYSDKKASIFPPNIKGVNFPALKPEIPIAVLIVDNRSINEEKGNVKYSSEELVHSVRQIIQGSQPNNKITFVTDKAQLTSPFVLISIEAYDAVFSQALWYARTKYVVEISRDGQSRKREIKSIRESINTLGNATAKQNLSKTFETATLKLLSYIKDSLQ